jgi:uncharacterized membrane protein YjdF
MSNIKNSSKTSSKLTVERLHYVIISLLQLILCVGLFLAISERHWQNTFTITCIILLMLAPAKLGFRFHIIVPLEFELMAILFVFASLFLGELHGYYTRYWWWDIALHTTSGLLLGVVGFLLVYILNEDSRAGVHLRPRFVALFAFMFAVTLGAIWEIFEFSMDQFFGMNMQKPMLGDPSGLTDTMLDLVVDTLGAAIISLVGWWHLVRGKHSVFDVWIQKFVDKNPRLFRDT